MNFKKPSSKTLIDNATTFGGVVVGSMLSRGAISVIHKPTVGADAATAKKEEKELLMKRGGLILVAGVAAASIEGKDTITSIVKAVCVGVSSMQAIELTKDVLSKDTSLQTATTPAKRFAKNALGLGCACSDSAPVMALGRPRRRALRMPVIDMEYQGQEVPNSNLIVNSY